LSGAVLVRDEDDKKWVEKLVVLDRRDSTRCPVPLDDMDTGTMVMQLNCEWSLRDIAAYHGCDVPTVIKMITEKVKAERQAEKELSRRCTRVSDL
jgi:hypothetical protein